MSRSAPSSFSTRDARDVRRHFWCIQSSDIDTGGSDCITVDGTLKLHSIRSSAYDDPTIFTRRYACFCEECLEGRWQECHNTQWVDAWAERVLTSLQVLPTSSTTCTPEIGETFRSMDYDSLTDILEEGDVFAVIAEEGNVEAR